MAHPLSTAPTALVLTGGGARAAYQVGVLQALAQLRQRSPAAHAGNPFPIVVGTSAGAINAAALACGTDDFDAAVAAIAEVWAHFRPEQVYHADALDLLDTPGRARMLWGLARLLARWRQAQPHSLLDNRPLADLLQRLVPLDRLPALLRAGHLQALAITASSYSAGDHCTFYQSAVPMEPWLRSQRRAVPGPISHAHLLASSAIPFVFPATPIGPLDDAEYFGDGSMRQAAPLSPAIHLGAARILAVGAGRLQEPRGSSPTLHTGRPSAAQIAGHALSSIFLDALGVDVERLHRINQTLALVPPAARNGTALRPVELLLIAPSQRLDAIAARHAQALPGVVRRLFAAGGPAAHAATQSSAFASYLLFDAGFTGELMALGRADTLAQAAQVCSFLGWT
ncbi:patatin-like phospholipase family protein [Pseudorhodoferax sp. Leaf265]|uniref:patatin-like phospholipase family protein n=1 Tax=Pseudorhodoferax sp. Leaf265 TaxID=1736315 RepID=UPI0006F5DF70|nr:patatin-like phospholipase family protein [Pseudorhodoferax sp. Leaf265]KQP17480.1 Patatin [Pseudorhodoferax sp. Leaf265]